MPDVEHEIVESDAGRQQVRKDPDGVVFAPDEIGKQAGAADEAHIPEKTRQRGFAGAGGADELDYPASAEEQDPAVADDLPRRHLPLVKGEQDFVHGKGREEQ